MKAAMNGAMNVSTLDGWWCEGYTLNGGWGIGAGEAYDDYDYQDKVESETIFNLFENEIVPLFYTRSGDNLPRAWIHRMKNSIKYITPRFNTHRMVAEYASRFYKPAAQMWQTFEESGMKKAKDLSGWKDRIRQEWNNVKVEDVDVQMRNGKGVVPMGSNTTSVEVGCELQISANVRLGKLKPKDVSVQIYHGIVDSWGNIDHGSVKHMTDTEQKENSHLFTGTIRCTRSGKCGFAIRVIPRHEELAEVYEPGLITWESTNGDSI